MNDATRKPKAGTAAAIERSLRMVRLRLTVAFDGSAYAGWQMQKIGRGVQEVVEAALSSLFPSRPRLHMANEDFLRERHP